MDRSSQKTRYQLLDAIRGLAIINMVLYHFSYDVCVLYGMWPALLSDMRAHVWQQYICFSFILISGAVWHLGRHHLRQGLLLSGLGLLFTLVTALFVPSAVIYFGVLSFLGCAMLLMIPLARPLSRIPAPIGFAASLILFALLRHLSSGWIGFGGWRIALPEAWYHGWLSTVLGLPFPGFFSSDYFPVFPWFFLFTAGHFACLWAEQYASARKVMSYRIPLLSRLGRYSIYVYVIHQPVCMALCMLIFGF